MKIPNLRWWLCGLLFLATALSFLDRQVLSIMAETICKALSIDNPTYGYVTSAFLISYGLMFLFGGWFLDRVGTRIGLGISVLVWSFASSLHAVAVTPFQLGAFRFLLGFGEGACFPGAAKAVSEWFPTRQRALATGIAIGGASLGAVIAPPLVVLLSDHVGWRGAFWTTGILGGIWVVLWFLFYHAPSQSPFITEKEKELIEADPTEYPADDNVQDQKNGDKKDETISYFSLFTRKDVIGLALARFLFDPVFHFYMFWIPKYLEQERGLSLKEIGSLTWIPFFALGVSNILGGFLSDHLITKGMPAPKARRYVMGAAALLTLSSSIAAFVTSVYTAIAMMSLLMFAHGFWITNYVTTIGDTFPKNRVASVMGITGLVGTIGGLLANLVTGRIVQEYSFLPIWIVSGFLYPAAFIAIFFLVRSTQSHENN